MNLLSLKKTDNKSVNLLDLKKISSSGIPMRKDAFLGKIKTGPEVGDYNIVTIDGNKTAIEIIGDESQTKILPSYQEAINYLREKRNEDPQMEESSSVWKNGIIQIAGSK